MKDLNNVFAANLRKCRKNLGWTQQELGDRIGYSEKAISKWESGNAIPPANALLQIADALQTTLDELLDCHSEPQYYLGIDGGATKTDFALTDAQGKMVNRVFLGSCNPVDIGLEAAKKVLENGIRQVCFGIPFRKIAMFAGISGGGSGDHPQLLREFFSTFRFARFDNGSDAQSIVAAGLGNEDGIAVIMGTGSIAYVQKDGISLRVGGLGYLFDNGGNGYSIGRDVIRAAICAEDGTGAPTALRDLVLQQAGADSALEHLTEFYRLGKRGIAAYAPLAIRAAKEGDTVANEILDRNMAEIAHLLCVGRKKLAQDPVKVVFVGGLTNESELLFPRIATHLDEPNAYTLTVYRDAPVYGALLLARQQRATEA